MAFVRILPGGSQVLLPLLLCRDGQKRVFCQAALLQQDGAFLQHSWYGFPLDPPALEQEQREELIKFFERIIATSP